MIPGRRGNPSSMHRGSSVLPCQGRMEGIVGTGTDWCSMVTPYISSSLSQRSGVGTRNISLHLSDWLQPYKVGLKFINIGQKYWRFWPSDNELFLLCPFFLMLSWWLWCLRSQCLWLHTWFGILGRDSATKPHIAWGPREFVFKNKTKQKMEYTTKLQMKTMAADTFQVIQSSLILLCQLQKRRQGIKFLFWHKL